MTSLNTWTKQSVFEAFKQKKNNLNNGLVLNRLLHCQQILIVGELFLSKAPCQQLPKNFSIAFLGSVFFEKIKNKFYK